MLKRFFKRRESYLLVVCLVLWVVISGVNPNFASPTMMLELIRFNSVYFICSLCLLPLMIKGEIDLSVGGMITATSVVILVIGKVFVLSFYSVVLLGIVLGCFFGCISGHIVGKYKVPSAIVTLSMMNVLYGGAKLLYRANNNPKLLNVSLNQESAGLFAIGLEGVILMVALLGLYYILRHTSIGRSIYAIGGNKTLSKQLYLNPYKTTMSVHAISGFGAGVMAAVNLLTFKQVSVDGTLGIEFELIIIVIIGGVSILGGTGNVFGTFIATMFVVMLKSGLVFVRVPIFWHDMIIGVIIIAVVSYDMFRYRVLVSKLAPVGD